MEKYIARDEELFQDWPFQDPSPLRKQCSQKKHQDHECDHVHDYLRKKGGSIEFTYLHTWDF